MTTIYLSQIDDSVKNEIQFANYLAFKCFRSLFFDFFLESKDVDKYVDVLNKSNMILIPVQILDEKSLSFLDKFHLKRPKNIIQFPRDFETFFKVIKVKEANLASLDSELSEYFSKGYFKQEPIFIVNSNPRLDHFEDVVAGISSSYIFYKKLLSDKHIANYFASILKREFQKYTKMYPQILKDFNFYYNIGTTAISKPAKSVKITKKI